MRVVLLLIGLLVVGCAPVNSSPSRRSPPPAPIVESSVTTAARSAFRTRDRDYADQLEQLAADVDAGNVKFDAKLKERLEAAKTHAGDAANGDLAKVMSTEFGPNALADPAKVSKSLRDLAKALK